MTVDLQLPVQSVPITTNVVSSNSDHRRGVPDPTLCDKVCQRLAAGLWISPVSSTNKTDRHITEILLNVALNNITLTLK
jgi:hypothetical protein